jgi:hypothetical protein
LLRDERAASYDEAEAVLVRFASMHGTPVPMVLLTAGYGIRRAEGGGAVGRQTTIAVGGVPLPFLQPFARRIADDGAAARWAYGIVIKAPLPLASGVLRKMLD